MYYFVYFSDTWQVARFRNALSSMTIFSTSEMTDQWLSTVAPPKQRSSKQSTKVRQIVPMPPDPDFKICKGFHTIPMPQASQSPMRQSRLSSFFKVEESPKNSKTFYQNIKSVQHRKKSSDCNRLSHGSNKLTDPSNKQVIRHNNTSELHSNRTRVSNLEIGSQRESERELSHIKKSMFLIY